MMNSIIALIFCACLYVAAKFITSYLRSKKLKRVNLLANFRQKIFMTACLGFFFISFFLILNYLARYFLKKEFLLGVFAYGMENPESFFYLAGVLFAANALLIYFVRLAVKRIYFRIKQSKEM